MSLKEHNALPGPQVPHSTEAVKTSTRGQRTILVIVLYVFQPTETV